MGYNDVYSAVLCMSCANKNTVQKAHRTTDRKEQERAAPGQAHGRGWGGKEKSAGSASIMEYCMKFFYPAKKCPCPAPGGPQRAFLKNILRSRSVLP